MCGVTRQPNGCMRYHRSVSTLAAVVCTVCAIRTAAAPLSVLHQTCAHLLLFAVPTGGAPTRRGPTTCWKVMLVHARTCVCVCVCLQTKCGHSTNRIPASVFCQSCTLLSSTARYARLRRSVSRCVCRVVCVALCVCVLPCVHLEIGRVVSAAVAAVAAAAIELSDRQRCPQACVIC